MGTKVTVMTDITIMDHEVEIDLDTVMEQLDSDDLWTALNENAVTSDVADLVIRDDDVLESVIEQMDGDQRKAAMQTWESERDVSIESMCEGFNKLTAPERDGFLSKLIPDLTTDECKRLICAFLAHDIDSGAVMADSSQMAMREFTRELRGAIHVLRHLHDLAVLIAATQRPDLDRFVPMIAEADLDEATASP